MNIKRDFQHLEEWRAFDMWLRSYLRKHLANFPDHHDDLVNEVYLGLLGIVKSSDTAEMDFRAILLSDTGRRLAMTILKRRVVDFYRSEIYGWASKVDQNAVMEDLLASAAEPDSDAHLKRLLRTCMLIVAKYPEQDRIALADYVFNQNDQPADVKSRKRISRLKQKLRSDIEAVLGTTISQLFK